MLSVLNRLGLTASSLPSIPINIETASDDSNEASVFPSLNSIQRSKPPPPPPSFSFTTTDDDDEEDGEREEIDEDIDFALPPIKVNKAQLTAPTSTVKLSKRVKVSIEPGYSQLDWARLKSSGVDLRNGITSLLRVTPSMLASHKSREDCWQAYNGKVYNVTPFLKYHPGGVGETMRAAGKDGTEMFMKTHAWVNVDMMMEGCMIGYMVRE